MARGNANAIRHTENVAVDRQAWHTKRVAQDDVGCLSANAG
jgi:hypothetical protein